MGTHVLVYENIKCSKKQQAILNKKNKTYRNKINKRNTK